MARGTRGSGMRNRGNRTPYVNPNPSNNQRGEWARRNRNQGDTVVVETPQKVLSEDPATSNTTPKTTKDQTVPDRLKKFNHNVVNKLLIDNDIKLQNH